MRPSLVGVRGGDDSVNDGEACIELKDVEDMRGDPSEGLGDRGAMIPSEVSLRDSFGCRLVIPTLEKRDLKSETLGGVCCFDIDVGEPGSAKKNKQRVLRVQ